MDDDGKTEAQIRDIREGMPRIERQGGEDGEDLPGERVGECPTFLCGDLVHSEEVDPCLHKLRMQVVPKAGRHCGQHEFDLLVDRLDLLHGCPGIR